MIKEIWSSVEEIIRQFCDENEISHKPEIRISRNKTKGDIAFVSLKRLSYESNKSPREVFQDIKKITPNRKFQPPVCQNDSVIYFSPNMEYFLREDDTAEIFSWVDRKNCTLFHVDGFGTPLKRESLTDKRVQIISKIFENIEEKLCWQQGSKVVNPAHSTTRIINPMMIQLACLENFAHMLGLDLSKTENLNMLIPLLTQKKSFNISTPYRKNLTIAEYLKRARTSDPSKNSSIVNSIDACKFINFDAEPDMVSYLLGMATDEKQYQRMWNIMKIKFPNKSVFVVDRNIIVEPSYTFRDTALIESNVAHLTDDANFEVPSIHIASALTQQIIEKEDDNDLMSNPEVKFFYPNLPGKASADIFFKTYLNPEVIKFSIELANLYLNEMGSRSKVIGIPVGSLKEFLFVDTYSTYGEPKFDPEKIESELVSLFQIKAKIDDNDDLSEFDFKEKAFSQLLYPVLAKKRQYDFPRIIHNNKKQYLVKIKKNQPQTQLGNTAVSGRSIIYYTFKNKKNNIFRKIWLTSSIVNQIPFLESLGKNSGNYIFKSLTTPFDDNWQSIEEEDYEKLSHPGIYRDIVVHLSSFPQIVNKSFDQTETCYLVEWVTDSCKYINRLAKIEHKNRIPWIDTMLRLSAENVYRCMFKPGFYPSWYF